MNIYVGNLDYNVEENTLAKFFEAFGTVNSVKIITDKLTGKGKGFGFVRMENKNEANKAIKELNRTVVNDREIVVKEAHPVKNRF
jgi:RNA recognition motif-containing protein